MKKIAAICCGLILLFSDISFAEQPSAWAKEQVKEAIEQKIVPIHLQSDYQKPVTRGEFCELAVALYEKKTGSVIDQLANFTDTGEISIRKMGGLGIVSGMGDGSFAPNRMLTREQAAVMLVNLYRAMGYSVAEERTSFRDREEISSWAVTAVGQAQASGIMRGMSENRFEPGGRYTREQSIVTMMNLYSKGDRGPFADSDKQTRQEIDREVFAGEIREEFYRIVNEHRRNHGLRALEPNPELQVYADLRAAEQRQRFGHQRPDGTPAGSGWYDSQNFMNTRFAENALSVHQLKSDPKEEAEYIFSRWRDSEGHNKHMLYVFDDPITMALGLDLQVEDGNRITSAAIWATGY